MVTQRRNSNVLGIREDGRSISLTLQRIGRVYEPTYPLREESVAEAFDEIQRRGKELVLSEPRLRDAQDEESEALDLVQSFIDAIGPKGEKQQRCAEALWASLPDAEALQNSVRRIEVLRDEVWQPFEKRARVLAKFGYLDFETEQVSERGRWLADLHVDRPLLIGEALERGLFAAIDSVRLSAVLAASTADEDRDYGELELDDNVVATLSQFEEIGFSVATEEWKHGIEPAPDLFCRRSGGALGCRDGVVDTGAKDTC
jgi:hypothetical protein